MAFSSAAFFIVLYVALGYTGRWLAFVAAVAAALVTALAIQMKKPARGGLVGG